jgi:transposase
MQSTPERGARAGFDPATCRRGAKVHLAVDTLGALLALLVTPANEQDRHPRADLAKQVQGVTGDAVALAFVDRLTRGSTQRKLPRLTT